MILAVDLNPRLCREFLLDDFARGCSVIAEEELIYSSGVGIDSARLMLNLKEDVTLLTFLGGERGNLIEAELNLKDIVLKHIEIKDKTQQEILLREKKRKTKVSTKYPRITREECDDYLALFNKTLSECNIVCIGENENLNLSDNFYGNLVKLSRDSNKRCCISYKGNNLEAIIEHKPFLIAITKDQLEDYSNISLNLTSEVIRVCENIIAKGVAVILVTNDSKGIIAVTVEDNYIANFKVKDHEGMLDKNILSAGCAIGLSREYDIETCLKLGIACAVSLEDISLNDLNMGHAKKVMKDIELNKTKRRIL